ncbi:sporulation protein [Bacillus dakarensis]|uniref:sporulation protein n=1 Tax=Robertmurraya dakarensis TaxID=1926278 RepID=UPI0009823E15|nr:sporulation protein [Bacillus dakarensis]
MNQPVGYLKEFLSNYTDRSDVAQEIYSIIREKDFTTESSFVRELNEQHISFLDQILSDAISYAKNEQDEERANQLNEIYELLF